MVQHSSKRRKYFLLKLLTFSQLTKDVPKVIILGQQKRLLV